MKSSLENPKVPLVVHVGFSGSRKLFSDSVNKDHRTKLESELQTCLLSQLEQFLSKFNLQNHFLCGVSQLAIGGDTLFVQACHASEIPSRVVLPQHKDEFLNAIGSSGPDFTPEQKKTASQLLDSPGVIQQSVSSSSNDRQTRFEQTNLDILRMSDILVILIREDATESLAGAIGLLERAKKRKIPTLEMRIKVEDGVAKTHNSWHNDDNFVSPTLPHELNRLEPMKLKVGGDLPDTETFCAPLKSYASAEASWYCKWFHRAAIIIILTHVLATILATWGLLSHSADHGEANLLHKIFPPIELGLLAIGLGFHFYLHYRHTAKSWAFVRLIAETNRSVRAVKGIHTELPYLFRLPLPENLKALFRTINVIHLNTTKSCSTNRAAWETSRDQYLSDRVDKQIDFYDRKFRTANSWRRFAGLTFTLFSLLALSVAIFNVATPWLSEDVQHQIPSWVASWSGGLSIIFPVISVAAMSLAAAGDLEARSETFRSTAEFLRVQRPFLEESLSETEFTELVLETEERLLGETANWFSRRSYLGVA